MCHIFFRWTLWWMEENERSCIWKITNDTTPLNSFILLLLTWLRKVNFVSFAPHFSDIFSRWYLRIFNALNFLTPTTPESLFVYLRPSPKFRFFPDSNEEKKNKSLRQENLCSEFILVLHWLTEFYFQTCSQEETRGSVPL